VFGNENNNENENIETGEVLICFSSDWFLFPYKSQNSKVQNDKRTPCFIQA
jgi:hypothetical protein